MTLTHLDRRRLDVRSHPSDDPVRNDPMRPTAEPDAPAAAPRTTIRARIAARLPEILIEALFLLIAVVLAFAVEEWREELELDRLAIEARDAIVQEVQRNRDELVESKQDTIDAIAALEAALAASESGAPTPGRLEVDFELALLSSAAWRTAQATEASRRMNYAWMLQVSQSYELQAMYQQAQWAAVEALVTLRTSGDEALQAESARTLLGRTRLVRSLGQALEEDYAKIL
jgi:hypothetical protein